MIKIVQGYITTLAVDAIVNAAKIAVREVREFYPAQRRRGDGSDILLLFNARRGGV